MTNTTTPTCDQAITADGTLVVTLANVAGPDGLDAFPLPTRYEVHQPAEGETVAGQPVAGWLHTASMLWAHQVGAVYRDLAERLGLGVYAWDERTLGHDEIPPTFRMVEGIDMEALLPLEQIERPDYGPDGPAPTPEQQAAARRACSL